MFLGGDLFGCDTSATPWADGDAAGSNDRPDESGRLHGAIAFSEGMHRGAENTGNRPEELVRLHGAPTVSEGILASQVAQGNRQMYASVPRAPSQHLGGLPQGALPLQHGRDFGGGVMNANPQMHAQMQAQAQQMAMQRVTQHHQLMQQHLAQTQQHTQQQDVSGPNMMPHVSGAGVGAGGISQQMGPSAAQQQQQHLMLQHQHAHRGHSFGGSGMGDGGVEWMGGMGGGGMRMGMVMGSNVSNVSGQQHLMMKQHQQMQPQRAAGLPPHIMTHNLGDRVGMTSMSQMPDGSPDAMQGGQSGRRRTGSQQQMEMLRQHQRAQQQQQQDLSGRGSLTSAFNLAAEAIVASYTDVSEALKRTKMQTEAARRLLSPQVLCES